MGVLLAFMFVWNMVGALVLLPALAYFLLPASCHRDAAAADGAATTPEEADSANSNQLLSLGVGATSH
ncbi:hypothetical protein D9M70_606910 [compost metagenome]